MADIYSIKKKHLPKFHRYGPVIIRAFFFFNPESIVTPDTCQGYPCVNSTLFNTKIPISMKNAATKTTVMKAERRWALVISNSTKLLVKNI